MRRAADTPRDMARLQVERWRRMSPDEKLRLATGLSMATRRLCLAGIRLRHPGATEGEVRLRLALITLGRELAVRAYPEAAAFDA